MEPDYIQVVSFDARQVEVGRKVADAGKEVVEERQDIEGRHDSRSSLEFIFSQTNHYGVVLHNWAGSCFLCEVVQAKSKT